MKHSLLSIAVAAAKSAGHYLTAAHSISCKEEIKESRHSIVTGHDIEAQRLIVEEIAQRDAGRAILSEEMVTPFGSEPGSFWVVDPLDGTSYFARGLPTYSVSIAFVDHEGLSLGVVFCPAADELFTAERHRGAFLNGQPLRVSTIEDSSKAICTFSHRFLREIDRFPERTGIVQGVRSIRGGGSCAQELAYLAAGRIDGFIAPAQSVWDYAAGAVILEEAGGRISNSIGHPVRIRHLASKGENIVASNGRLHNWLLNASSSGVDHFAR